MSFLLEMVFTMLADENKLSKQIQLASWSIKVYVDFPNITFQIRIQCHVTYYSTIFTSQSPLFPVTIRTTKAVQNGSIPKVYYTRQVHIAYKYLKPHYKCHNTHTKYKGANNTHAQVLLVYRQHLLETQYQLSASLPLVASLAHDVPVCSLTLLVPAIIY